MSNLVESNHLKKNYRSMIHEVIFEADTPSGKLFDIILLFSISASVLAVSLESVDSINHVYGDELYVIEWLFTILFSIEYLLRLYSVMKPIKYATSFFGVVDLVSILPSFIGLLFPFAGFQSLLVLRALRLLRIFRIFKLTRYLGEATALSQAIIKSKNRIIVFLSTIIVLSFITGAGMYLVEGPSNGFTSIPQSVYWAITTLTSTGYGDTVPQTPLGKMLAIFIMIMGYSLIIVPTGIITNQLVKSTEISTQACLYCSKDGHDINAKHCKYCGTELNPVDLQ
ncbi:MAG: ion transporter [Euryarchaeota archaeon]|jgi:voltage-gated potassium channel|nr:ion transporter [Euryarchaeota archaeon]MBT4475649.1 ion transporter [Euryarchaeota archaeon]MBT7820865.1 ion transporter [Euryarchaeota archaeon]